MFFRFGSKSGKAVPPAGQALEEIHFQLGLIPKSGATETIAG
jgi:hypothetical protein